MLLIQVGTAVSDFQYTDSHYREVPLQLFYCMLYFAGPGEYESPAFLGKAKTGMICSKDGRFKPVKSLVPGPGTYAVSEYMCVCVCVCLCLCGWCMYT